AGAGLGGPAVAALRRALPGAVDPEAVAKALAELARDTVNGLAVFVFPGPDEYSKAQGTPRSDPGAMEAKTPDFLIHALDHFVPAPDVANPLNAALASGLGATPIPLPDSLLSLPLGSVDTLDAAVRVALQSDETIPVSVTIALLLNLTATQVNPAAVSGPFLSPFARLTYAEKAAAFSLLEGANSDLVATLDNGLPQPLSRSVSGLMKFVGGALLEFAGYGSYSEWAVFDRASKQLTGRPVGWRLTGYQPNGPVEGWDDLLGYYPGTKEG
ncbi:MAG: hypothetical protein ACRDT2_17810, partial [Natronosporangium sp.]